MLSGPPAATELEISLFGPGVGESVVLHLGLNRWMVVDSCRTRNGVCVPLAYLHGLGVDVGTAVVDVVASHAHDDHVRGIAELLEAASSAAFCVPTAATRDEFMAALDLDVDLGDLRQRVFREFDEAYSTSQQRGTPRRRCHQGLEIRHLARDADFPEVAVHALSPSEADVDDSLADLSRMINRLTDQTTRLTTRDPNHFAMAIWIRAGDVDVMLGSDVLTGADGLTGWDAIVHTYQGRFRSQLFKVPHHGSITGHHDGAWSDLTTAPIALVTPFTRSGLPKDDDLTRISTLASSVYLTARGPKPTREQRAVSSSLQGVAQNIRWLQGGVGHVRARIDAVGGGLWRVERDEVATKVS